MIEQALVSLVQSGLGNLSVPGGFAVQLPKDLIGDGTHGTYRSAWLYRSISADPSHHLTGEDGLVHWRVQIDCHGYAMADAIALARAIHATLRDAEFPAALSDPDSTYVFSICRQPPTVDGFDDANRTYVRSLEYLISYDQI